MKLPDDVQLLLKKRFAGKHRDWLAADNPSQQWPLLIPLGPPSEAEALKQTEAVRAWAAAWREWRGEGELNWIERRWRVLGTQRLPESLRLDGPHAVCAWIGELGRWQLAEQRHQALCGRWPQLAPTSARLFNILADMESADFSRCLSVLEWLEVNPASGLYLRQLPIPGVDTKWIETRKGLLAKLLTGMRGTSVQGDNFYAMCGLQTAPAMVHMRLLDPELRMATRGLRDICAPAAQLAGMNLSPSTVLVVENQQTGLALPDLPGAVAFIGLGYGVDVLAQIPWIRNCQGIYWGDIDTHGYAILHRARSHLPQLQSLLMDEATLLQFSSLWTTEGEQSIAEGLSQLLPPEATIYQGLKQHRWGHGVRLEQERISWPFALRALQQAIRSPT
ncbi:DUF3322 domain-containing protein [Pseudoduganella violaceinigra]|uniref:DUF3322 domain-containing protein n=1 Tax=Pseudoduganella violaceinigra TaxID=246602 RepID=UPI000413486A|nr:DUF3322 and DUF2220 domain-containing protein [Pseudoduganella violaceinigra]